MKTPSREDVLKFFKRLDKSGDGFLSAQEVDGLIRNFRPKITQAQVADYILKTDKDGDQKLNFEEFYELFTKPDIGDVPETNLQELFQKLDKDNSGFLDAYEVKILLSGVDDFDEEAINKEVAKHDSNEDGKISFAEFTGICQKLKK